MYKIVKWAILVCFLTSLLAMQGSQQAIAQIVTSPSEDSYVPGEMLIKYKSDSQILTAEYYQEQIGITTIKAFERIGVRHIKLPEGMNVDEAMNTFQNDPNVEYAEPNYYYYPNAVPNDTYFDMLWGLHNTGQDVNGTVGVADSDIDAPEAWDIITSSTEVIVAVIDSGVDYYHPELADNIWVNLGEIAGNGLDDDGNGYIDDVRGWDFFDTDNDPMDSFGHGTYCAGIIGAAGNNGIGITGVNWNSKIMALRVGHENGYPLDGIVKAIEYANNNSTDIINCGWGWYFHSQALKDSIYTSSAVFVCAAGNDGLDNDVTSNYPSSYESPNIIAVTATDQFDNLWTAANYGATSVDVSAPGENILSCFPGNEYYWGSGTSPAAAYVSGLAALLLAKYPLLVNSKLKAVIGANVDTIGALNGLIVTGGRVNAFKALSSSPAPPAAVVGGGGGGGGG